MNKNVFIQKCKRRVAGLMAACMVIGTAVPMIPVEEARAAAQEPYVVSTDRAVYASSSENSYVAAENAVDSDLSTRWSSEWTGNTQWLYVDLGKETTITGVNIHWEGAFAKEYRIQLSNDETNWQDAYHNTNGNGGIETIALNGKARFVRLYCEQKMMEAYGYSVFEFEVYGLDGLNKPAPEYGENIALNKSAAASSISTIWWLQAYYPPGAADASNAVDGKTDTLWRSSEEAQDQWIYVDLGRNYEIGRVILDWNNDGAGRIYDIQVSNDARNWTTLYREMRGAGGKKDLELYANARYVRMYGYSKNATGNGFWLNEFQVYEYKPGDAKPGYSISPLPRSGVVSAGGGSYLTNDMYMPQPKLPSYRDSSLQAPIASNDWWQSILITEMGNALCTLPLKVKYEKKGLGIWTAGDGWVNDRSVVTEGSVDFYVSPGNMDAGTLYNEVADYSDYAVRIRLKDANTAGMESMVIKGSPYVFNEFRNTTEAQIYSTNITSIYIGQNQEILQNNGDVVTADHIGLEITDRDNKEGTLASKSNYCLTVPAGTAFKRVGSKIKITFPSRDGYMSVASMTDRNQLDFFYQHGYAFVTDTKVSYHFDEDTSRVITDYALTTQLKRDGFTDQSVQCLLPHQWKKSDASLSQITYPSVRGDLRLHEGNTFVTEDTFYGIVPQFTLPSNGEYDNNAMKSYLENLNKATSENIKSADAYWQGKSLHPLAMGLLAADQMGESEYMTLFISRLRDILADWFTYSGKDDECFLYYDPEWGTMYYRVSEFGANTGITDHHFTYGYLVFAATVLATYDNDFYNTYKDMIEHMVRDYANPSDNDPMYPKFRNYDMYEGHSWAGGYADNDSGNNQEAAGESLFGWVGEYLWGVRTGNQDYRDAGIFGFTTELNAVKQYWFNFDGDNWIDEWTHTTVGQVYGSTNFFGTFFHGDPLYVYGIHWLPTSEYLTSYGFDKAAAAKLYQGLVDDVAEQKALRPGDSINGPDDDWQHITWPIQSLSDPAAVLAKWDASRQSRTEGFNTYWFVNNMADLGGRTTNVWAVGGKSATVYEKNGNYQALVWNPADEPVTIQFRNAAGITGSVTVKAKALARVNPMIHTQGEAGNPTPPAGGGENPPVTEGVNVAAGKSVTASSSENDGSKEANLVDGDEGTRWASGFSDNEWIYVDLGEKCNVASVVLKWEAAYAKAYEIQTSEDGVNWTKAAEQNNGMGGVETVTFRPVSARYVKMQGITRALPYGYSLWEMEVYCAKSEEPENPDITGQELVSKGKVTAASGSENDTMKAENAVDGDAGTRWSSQHEDNAWLYVDLGQSYNIATVRLNWEAAYGRDYEIQVSDDGVSWTTAARVTDGKGGIETVTFRPVSARYVKMQGITRALPYGYSLWEMEVYASGTSTPGQPEAGLLSQGKYAFASEEETVGTKAVNVTDGDTNSRWSSGFSDNQWIAVDLGKTCSVNKVVLNWEGAYGKAYEIQVSADGVNYISVYGTQDGKGGIEEITFNPVNARYVKMQGVTRALPYGYSLYEIEVYGTEQ